MEKTKLAEGEKPNQEAGAARCAMQASGYGEGLLPKAGTVGTGVEDMFLK